MRLPAGEPAAGPWRAVPVAPLLDLVLVAAGDAAGQPRIVAVNGTPATPIDDGLVQIAAPPGPLG